jgi:hypothetical protein
VLGNTLAAAPANQEVFYLCREKCFDMAGFLKRVQPYLNQSDYHHHHSQRDGNKYNENPSFINWPCQRSAPEREKAGEALRPLRQVTMPL